MSGRAGFGDGQRLQRGIRQFVRSVLQGQGVIPAFAQTFATQVFVLILNVATGIFTARVLGPAGRGVFTAVTLWPQFMAALMMLGLNNALVFHMRRSPTMANSVVTAGLAIGALLAAVGAAIGAVVIPLTMGDTYSRGVIAFAVASTAIVTAVNLMTMLLRPAFIVYGRLGTSNNSAWANPLFYLAILLVAWCVVPMTAELAAACQFFSAILVLAWMGVRLAQVFHPDFSGFPDRSRSLASYMLRSAPGEAMVVLGGSLDRLVLVPLIPAADLGLYAVAYSLSRLLTVLQAALAPVALPAMANRTPEEAKDLHDKLFRFTLYAVLGVAAGAFLLGGWALRLFYGHAYAPAAILFKILVLEAALGCLNFLPAQLFMSLGRPGFLSVLQMMSFVVMLLGLVLLVPALGARGAALAMLLSAVFRLCSLLCGLRFVLGFSLPRIIPASGDLTRIGEAFRSR